MGVNGRSIMLRCFIAVCALFLVPVVDVLAGGTEAEEELEQALAIIEHQETNLSTLKLEYDVYDEQVDLTNMTSGKLEKLRHKQSLITDDERRRLESHLSMETVSGSLLERDDLMTYDGKRYCTYESRMSAGSISTSNSMDMCFLDYVYGSKNGLLDRLRRAQKDMESMEVERVEEEGRSLLKVTFKKDLSELVFLLDPDAAYQPRRITKRADVPAHMVEATGTLKTKTDLLITGYLREDGFCFPQDVEYDYEQTMKDGTVIHVLHRELVLTKATLNPPVDPDMFQIRFPSGTEVTLYDIGVTFRTDAPQDAYVLETHLGAEKTTSPVAEESDSTITHVLSQGQTGHADRSLSPEAQPPMAKRGSWRWFLYIPIIAAFCIIGAVIMLRKPRAKFGRSDDKADGGRV